MAAAKGNQYAAKERRFVAMLQRVLQHEGDGDALRRVALKLVEQAEAGEGWAIKELADRLDGKPVQQVDMNANINQPMTLTDAYLAHVAAGGKPDDYSETAKTEH